MRHSQNFDRIDSVLKPVLDIFILCNLIVGWGRGSLKRGLVFWIKYIDSGGVLIGGESRIHRSKSWYYLESFQTCKLELFAKIIFDYKAFFFLCVCVCEKVQLRYFTGSNKNFLCFVSKILHLEITPLIFTPICLSLLFQEM